jgi:radical SAM protein with 4Fe4S-binding SPASM domain
MNMSSEESKTITDADWLKSMFEKRLRLPDPGAVVERTKGGEHLFINMTTGQWWRTNDEGREVIRYAREGAEISEIVDKIGTEYGLDEDMVCKCVAPFLRKAVERRYMTIETDEIQPSPDGDSIPPVKLLWVEVTDRCQLHCPFCFARGTNRVPPEQEMTVGDFARLMEEPLVKKAERITISGGEPTIRKDILSIMRTVRDKYSGEISFISNGQVQDKGLWEQLAELATSIQISMDGPNEKVHDALRGKGSFAKAVATVRTLAATKLSNLHIAFTPTDKNVSHLPEMVSFAYEHGASLLHCNTFCRSTAAREHDITLDYEKFRETIRRAYRNLARLRGWVAGKELQDRPRGFHLNMSADQLHKLVESRKRLSCGAGYGNMRIGANGGVYPCSDLRDEEWCVGNVREEPVAVLYERLTAWNRELTVDKLENCRSCDVRFICGGGCRASAFYETGDIQGKDPRCGFLQDTINETMWSLDI